MVDWDGIVETDWGESYLERYRAEETYCDCRFCEGHVEWILMPEDEWYWRPLKRVVDMADMPRLEAGENRLFALLSTLGRGD